MTRLLALLAFVLVGTLRGVAADVAANKALFDRAVDRLNFQTMEGVYDARFARKKFPLTLQTRLERRAFKDFNGDAAFEKLFLNYNDEAEKYKNRFGSGAPSMATFEKALRGILVDANFEFFLAKAARREDRAAIIRKLEGTIKQAVRQYDASGEAPDQTRQPDTLAGATGSDDAITDAPVAEAQVDDLNESATPTPDAPNPAPASAPANSGWGGTLALLLALGAAGGVAYLLFVVVPALRQQMMAAPTGDPDFAPAPDDHLPPTMAEEARQRGVEMRFELLADELDEMKARVRELESRLAEALAAPDYDDRFAAPVAVPAPAYAAAAADDDAADDAPRAGQAQ